MLGQEAQWKNYWNEEYAGINFPLMGYRELNMAGSSYGIPSYKTRKARLASFLLNTSYDYQDKYYGQVSYRRDGSSVFGSNNRWGNFWSVGGKWRISEEEFLKDNDVFTNLAIRASYGTVGNQDIDWYASRGFYKAGYNYNNEPGIAPESLNLPDLGWETSKKLNIGLDITLIRKWNLTVDFYNEATTAGNTDDLAYFGMPLFESGYLAADLLVGRDPGVKEVVSFNIDRGEAPPNDSTLNRHRGFLAYLNDNNPGCTLTDCSMSPFDFLYNMRLFDAFFEEHPDVRHIITFNSRAHLISDWMEIRGIRDKKLLGFDMLQANMRALKNGTISVLVAERTDKEAFKAVKSLIDFLVLRQRPPRRDNYSSIDILTRYNVDFYLVEVF